MQSNTVAVVSDRSLVADAVGAALAGSGLTIVRLPWPGGRRDPRAGWPQHRPRPVLGLIICDLAPPATRTARWLVRAYPTRWLLLTDTPKGPPWGALLERGVVGILPSSTGLSDVLAEIEAVRAGAAGPLPSDRDELVATWRRDEAERTLVHSRIRSLTPRESEVLRMLHLGRSVNEIASIRGVARSTVRSQVRSVLRKLGVSSQLAAAALLDRWGEPGPPDGTPASANGLAEG